MCHDYPDTLRYPTGVKLVASSSSLAALVLRGAGLRLALSALACQSQTPEVEGDMTISPRADFMFCPKDIGMSWLPMVSQFLATRRR